MAIEAGVAWAHSLNAPWTLAGATAFGVPTGMLIAAELTENARVFSLVRYFVLVLCVSAGCRPALRRRPRCASLLPFIAMPFMPFMPFSVDV